MANAFFKSVIQTTVGKKVIQENFSPSRISHLVSSASSPLRGAGLAHLLSFTAAKMGEERWDVTLLPTCTLIHSSCLLGLHLNSRTPLSLAARYLPRRTLISLAIEKYPELPISWFLVSWVRKYWKFSELIHICHPLKQVSFFSFLNLETVRKCCGCRVSKKLSYLAGIKAGRMEGLMSYFPKIQ